MPVRVVEAATASPPVQTRAAADAREDRSRQ